MNFNFKQSQFELFPGSPGSTDDAQRPRYLFTDLTLSLENIILICIIGVMIFLFSYSWGVEKGRMLPVKKPAAAATKTAAPSAPVTAASSSPALTRNKNQPAKKFAPAHAVPAATPAPAAQQSPATVLENFYTIQVASFKLETNAQKEADLLKKRGYPSLVVAKGSHSIVCVGKFSQSEEAKSFVAKFKNKNREYKDCLVRALTLP